MARFAFSGEPNWPGQNFEKKMIDPAARLEFFIGEANLLKNYPKYLREFIAHRLKEKKAPVKSF